MATLDEAHYDNRVLPQNAAPASAPARSPFTPIADYGFLSNCHTGALLAPDGTVDWLCVPRFDSSSVFGALLDRGAGGFRFAPFGINVPSDRIYEPGTNSLVTSWKTATGWLVVRDALTMGPRRGPDTVTPHTRPPADEDADHTLVRTASCIAGTVEIDLLCEPAVIGAENMVRERFDGLGSILRRIGRPPKRAIPFRTKDPFKKLTTLFTATNGADPEKIEFLADGLPLS